MEASKIVNGGPSSANFKARVPKKRVMKKAKSQAKKVVGELLVNLSAQVAPIIVYPGDEVKCTLTGFSGAATAVCYYRNDLPSVEVTAKTKKEDKRWISVTRLKVTKRMNPIAQMMKK